MGQMDNKKALECESLPLEKGPYRTYQPVNSYWHNDLGRLKLHDVLVSITITVAFIAYMVRFHASEFTSNPSEAENEILIAIEYYKLGKFRLVALPPFGIQLLSLVPLNKEILRQLSLTFSSLTLAVLYLTLRRVDTYLPFALGCVTAIASLPLYQEESVSVSVDTLQWLLLALSFYSWRTVLCSRIFSKKWFNYMILLSITLGLGASTKFAGTFVCIWIATLAMKGFWGVLGDPKLPVSYLLKYTLFKVLFLGIIPFAIFTSSYALQLGHWSEDSPEFSQYMTPNFKAYLRGPIEQPKFLYYGSIVTLRHVDSLGGYLHSHNHTYLGGSQEQQVTLTQEENDYNNQWIVEPARPKADAELKEVKDFGKIRLRHRATGKLLRASSAKPPVSEQEYTSEISCTGDADYVGDSDELWTAISVGDPLHSPIMPIKSAVKFLNEGHRCTLLSHDTRLPEWAFYQQEVLCVQSPNEARTLFEFETLQLNTTEEIEYSASGCNWNSIVGLKSLLIELIQRQYKWNNYVPGFQHEPNSEKWPFHLFKQRYVNHIWLSSVLYPICFFIYQTLVALIWDIPSTTVSKAQASCNVIYFDFAIECILGWLNLYRPMLAYPFADQRIVTYLPSLILGQLLVWKAMDTWTKTRPWVAVPLCVYVAYTVRP